MPPKRRGRDRDVSELPKPLQHLCQPWAALNQHLLKQHLSKATFTSCTEHKTWHKQLELTWKLICSRLLRSHPNPWRNLCLVQPQGPPALCPLLHVGDFPKCKLAPRPLDLPSNQIIFLVKIKIQIPGDCQMEGTAPHTSFFKGRKQAKCKRRLMQYIQEREIRLNVMYVPRGLLQAREKRE